MKVRFVRFLRRIFVGRIFPSRISPSSVSQAPPGRVFKVLLKGGLLAMLVFLGACGNPDTNPQPNPGTTDPNATAKWNEATWDVGKWEQ
jgi:hypothetical protein